MRRFSGWLAVAAALALAACKGSSTGGGGCTDACPSAGATQCSGTDVQTCRRAGTGGCLAWSTPAACPGAHEACSPAASACVATCTDACPSAGATQCSGAQIQTCQPGGDGCLAWSSAAACPGTLACDAPLGACTALVTVSWAQNREAGVNSAGGGYELQISGQPSVLVPYVSGPAAPTSADVGMRSGSHTVVVRAFAGLDPQGGATRTFSAPSASIVVNVP